jgi:DNA repair protein RecO (recombination protein O)
MKVITDAIVVRVVDYGEADRVATLVTRSSGKVSALARGARRSRKRFGGALELFGAGEAVLVERRGDLWTLETLHSRRGFPRLALDVARVAHGAYLCELVRELLPDRAADEPAYLLLEEALGALDGGEPSAVLLRAFELKLLEVLGLGPSLDRCVGCGAPGAAGDAFDARGGGLACRACRQREGLPLPPTARAALIAARDAPLARAGEVAFDDADALAARDALQALLGEHLHRPLRSVEFIAKLNHAVLRG